MKLHLLLTALLICLSSTTFTFAKEPEKGSKGPIKIPSGDPPPYNPFGNGNGQDAKAGNPLTKCPHGLDAIRCRQCQVGNVPKKDVGKASDSAHPSKCQHGNPVWKCEQCQKAAENAKGTKPTPGKTSAEAASPNPIRPKIPVLTILKGKEKAADDKSTEHVAFCAKCGGRPHSGDCPKKSESFEKGKSISK